MLITYSCLQTAKKTKTIVLLFCYSLQDNVDHWLAVLWVLVPKLIWRNEQETSVAALYLESWLPLQQRHFFSPLLSDKPFFSSQYYLTVWNLFSLISKKYHRFPSFIAPANPTFSPWTMIRRVREKTSLTLVHLILHKQTNIFCTLCTQHFEAIVYWAWCTCVFWPTAYLLGSWSLSIWKSESPIFLVCHGYRNCYMQLFQSWAEI